MRIPFTKMHGAGNDFVVLDRHDGAFDLAPPAIRQLCDRRLGVGCDQLLVVLPARSAREDFSFRIFNPDASEAEQCGNGVRCIARLLHERGVLAGKHARLGSLAGVTETELLADDRVRAAMGVPRFEPRAVPFDAEARAERYALSIEGRSYEIGAVSMGNPHAVLRVPSVDAAPVATLGPAIERHPRFPQHTNVGFMQRVSAERIRLRVHERGVGETLACGSGACAAVAWGRLTAELAPRVAVELPGGTLVVEWNGESEMLYLTGPAVTVFAGEITL